ncbi:protein ROOT HAIR DEFECTIVE 3 homolog 2 [Rosa chinensis]|uniref:protein ROOT HAIR DEFECTIVE 3 homolog 2 n=1 Tax=Rosa chinensis TaxID=74649 RepID=UPI000D08CB63|nr:protein ROOT HAIR DEFECTIVE 3 homolog 2 [Rosa chinensis]
MEKDYCVTQLIDGRGEFNASGIDIFTKDVNFAACGESYAIVAVMGPQSSGKSTLMNHLFHTDFKEMDGRAGRNQTTLGIWIAKCVGIEPFTIAVDLEGSDGRERGSHDTAFEKQSALFALAISDILLINMWCIEIGREQAANKPLLRTVFQVMMSLFGPGRKKTLLFVVRDKIPETPLERLEATLLTDINKIWDEVPKPQQHESTHLSECFKVEVVALSHYVYERKKFEEEVAELRQRFSNSISPEGLAGGDRNGVVPASGFSFSAQHIWKQIKQNKDLDLPSLNVMVANVRCEEIANEIFNQLTTNQDWLKLEEAVKIGIVEGFGEMVSSILESCFNQYEMETKYFDKTVKNTKRRDVLEKKAYEFVHPAYTTLINNIRFRTFKEFKVKLQQALDNKEDIDASVQTLTESSIIEFNHGCTDAAIKDANWDVSSTRNILSSDIKGHAETASVFEDLKRVNLKDKKEAKEQFDRMEKKLAEERERYAKQLAKLQALSNRGPLDFVGQIFEDVGNAVGGAVVVAANAVGGVAVDGANAVAGVAVDGANAVAGVAVDGANAVAGVAVDGANAVAGVAVDGVNAVSSVAVDGANAVGGAAVDVANAVGGAAVDVANAVGGVLRF